MARKTPFTQDEFKAFFDDAAELAKGAKGPNSTLMQVLKKHGLEPQLPTMVAEKLLPMLNHPIGQMRSIPHNCNWCGACSLCAFCGELNAASGGASSAALLHFAD